MRGWQRRIPRANLVRVLLACGIAYPLLYVVENDVIAATRYEGYSRMSQAISELSAKDAPTRKILAETLPFCAALMAALISTSIQPHLLARHKPGQEQGSKVSHIS